MPDNKTKDSLFGVITGYVPLSYSSYVVIGAFAFLFSLSLVLPRWAAKEIAQADTVVLITVYSAMCFIALASLYSLFCSFIPSGLSSNDASAAKAQPIIFWIVFICMGAVSVYALLCNYPGMYTRDSNDIIRQALGMSQYANAHRYEGLSNHHPLAYTFIVWLFLRLEPVIGLYKSLAIFSLFQIAVTSFSCAYAVSSLDKVGSPKPYTILCMLFFICSPLLIAYSITMWKDVLFSEAMLVLSIQLYFIEKEQDCLSARDLVVPLLLCFAISLLRSNGPLISIAITAILALKLKPLRRVIAASACMILLFLYLINGPILSLLNGSKAHFSESVSIPLQQIARTVVDGGDINDDELSFIDSILPIDIIREQYNPITPNPIKFSEQFDDGFLESHKYEFIKLWLKLLPRNLDSYLCAWIEETDGFWVFGYEPTLLTANNWLLDVKGPGLLDSNFPRDDDGKLLYQDKTPVLYSAGSLAWVMLFWTMVMIVRRREVDGALGTLPFLPSIFLFLTLLLAVPHAGDYRYLFSAFLLLPFYPVFAFSSRS